MARLVAPFLLFVSLAACSHGGAPDPTDGEDAPPRPVALTTSGFRVDPRDSDIPCRPVGVTGCDSDGSDDGIAVACEGGESLVVTGDTKRVYKGRVLLCASVGTDQTEVPVLLSEGNIWAGSYSVVVPAKDSVLAARTVSKTGVGYDVVLWGFGPHPFGWTPETSSLIEIPWASGTCVGDGLKVACGTINDPRTWRVVDPMWGAGDIVARGVDFTPQTLIDVDLDGTLDLAGTSASGLAWAGPKAHGTWPAVGPSVIGLGAGVLIAPTVTGGWGLHAGSAIPLPSWGSPLQKQPVGAVIQRKKAPRVLVVDPATRHAWTISTQPPPVP